ncbi:ACBP4, partial [Symbiodinium sp. KB8]
DKFNVRVDVLIDACVRALGELMVSRNGAPLQVWSDYDATAEKFACDEDTETTGEWLLSLFQQYADCKEALGRLRCFVAAGGQNAPHLIRTSFRARRRLNEVIEHKDRMLRRVLSTEQASPGAEHPGAHTAAALHKMLRSVSQMEFQLMGCFARSTPLEVMHEALANREREREEYDVTKWFGTLTSVIDLMARDRGKYRCFCSIEEGDSGPGFGRIYLHLLRGQRCLGIACEADEPNWSWAISSTGLGMIRLHLARHEKTAQGIAPGACDEPSDERTPWIGGGHQIRWIAPDASIRLPRESAFLWRCNGCFGRLVAQAAHLALRLRRSRAAPLRQPAAVSKGWHELSLCPEILPFARQLRCRLLTSQNVCKRSGEVWPPGEGMEVHRTGNSQPLGDRDMLVRFFHACLHRDFGEARQLRRRLDEARTVDALVELLSEFRSAHFARPAGPGHAPPPVWCSAAAVLPGGRLSVVGGGCYSYELANAQTRMVEVLWNQPHVYIFDIAQRSWSRQPTQGTPPPIAHTYAAAHTLLGDKWVFWCGGYYGQAYNTAYSLDVQTWTWRSLRNSSDQVPTARYFVSSFEFNGALYAWGGRSSQSLGFSEFRGQGFMLQFPEWGDTPLGTPIATIFGAWIVPEPIRMSIFLTTQQSAIESRSVIRGLMLTQETEWDSYKLILVCMGDDRFAVLFGGGQWQTGGRFQSDADTFSLDLETFEWTKLQTYGSEPTPRLQHSALNLGGNLVLVFGGYEPRHRRYLGLESASVLNVRSLQWMKLHKGPVLQVGCEVKVKNVDGTDDVATIVGGPVRMPRREVQGWRIRDINDDVRIVAADQLTEVSAPNHDACETDEESAELMNWHAPGLDDLSYIDIQDDDGWVIGQFPCRRAGMAVAPTAARGCRSFFIFGGAQYVHQEWYSDVFECSLDAEALAILCRDGRVERCRPLEEGMEPDTEDVLPSSFFILSH